MEKDTLFWKVANGERPVPDATALLGWKFILFDQHKRQVEVLFKAGKALTTPLGFIHGGMLTAMLDDCMGPAVLALLKHEYVAVSTKIETRFIKPALPGSIIGHGQVIRSVRQYRYTTGVLMDEQENILATAKATYKVIYRPEHADWPIP
ncbi:PaaI family thioesterase [Pseudomonas entomophila]|uniref:PaaI family thioesterase n=1 Tax=Pseudomonas entomophila TaxID=312306 RepID=UPI0023D85871|nr:PaaI family thioesterase [Pseudomonas entomophila]MDF0732679.1 PaaI family thioesterase [Pseudomonas entomophila]